MDMNYDEKIWSIASQLFQMPLDHLKMAIKNFEAPSNREVIISSDAVRQQFGWSYQTFRRRLTEYGITQLQLPGWRGRLGVNKADFEEKSGLVLEIHIPVHKDKSKEK